MALTMAASPWFVVGAAGMAVAALLVARRLLAADTGRRFYAILVVVPGVAAAAYALMAIGVGSVATPRTVVQVPRYADWLVTTPLLVAYLAMIAGGSRRVVLLASGLAGLMMAGGLAVALLAPPTSWGAFGVGVLAYLGLVYVLLRVLPRRGDLADDRVEVTFTKLRNLVVVLWTIYPVVWLLGPTGVGLLGVATEGLVVTYLDLIAKVGFVGIALNGGEAVRSVVGEAGPGVTGTAGSQATE